MAAICDVCFRHCRIEEGMTGFCMARVCTGGKIISLNYGRAASVALDPIEKKPLNRFCPGSLIVSVGGYGCNLACPFCQNHEISLSEQRLSSVTPASDADLSHALRQVPGVFSHMEPLPPDELAVICESYRDAGNIGVAFTYNEPTIAYEYVIDTAKLLRPRGMKTVLVTNGSASDEVLDKLLPWTDAMNIDLKSFHKDYYARTLYGDLHTTMHFIERAAGACHVEVTTLIVPGDNDTDEEMEQIASWISDIERKSGREIPLHVTRFFPRSLYSDRKPTEIRRIFELADVARRHLRWVYEGNV